MESHELPSRQPQAAIRKTPDGPVAVINGAEVPIVEYAVGSDQAGNPVLTLVVTPGYLTIGGPIAEDAPAAADYGPRVSSWGDGSHPDPRERIPGWEPELSQQVANHAERVALRQILSPIAYLRRLGGEGGSVAVTA